MITDLVRIRNVVKQDVCGQVCDVDYDENEVETLIFLVVGQAWL